MQLGGIELPEYPAEVITQEYLLRGRFRPIGPMLAYLNDSERRYIQFNQATLLPFDAASPMGKLERPTVMVRKDNVVAISLLDEAGGDAAQLLVTKHKMIVYSTTFVIQGYFHMGADDVPMDVLSSSSHDFMGATDANIYPLKDVQNRPQTAAQVMLVNRHGVLFYHQAE